MKLTNFKTIALMLSASALLALNGCGSTGTESDSGFGDTTPPTPVLPIEPPADTNDTNDTPPTVDTVTYTDYLGNTRTATAKPGDAEVHTGMGPGQTVFDSADKKCQHCHNRLYDTWKSSMHSKSWSDKIFQSKQQDFLRTHLAKVGAKNTTEGTEYTTTTFGKVGKTCSKCHAPAAFYSNDFQITLTDVQTGVTDLNSTEWATLKGSLESNLAGKPGYDPHSPSTVASIGKDGVLRTATYAIGHENNREGINCATCHSIETVRMMTDDGSGDGGTYTLASTMRGNVIGEIVHSAGDTLVYNSDASDPHMNAFFKLVGPEKYKNVAKSPHNVGEYDAHTSDFNKTVDGRYTFRGIDLNGTDGKTHYTGGPFYGPYGVTGLGNSNDDDDTNRSAQVNDHFGVDYNHFKDNGKALCLSCHQRSAGALVPSGADQGDFMELCTTWTAVSNGTGTNENDIAESPKCQSCHMARVDEPMILHKWAEPTEHFTQADMHLTPHFDPDDTTTTDADNPVKGEWLADHAFVGGNKLGASNYVAKFQSGFEAQLDDPTVLGQTVTVTTGLRNKTAHMFPAAHPMRRLLTRVTVTDINTGIDQNFTAATGSESFDTITNTVVTGKSTDTINATGDATVDVVYNDTRVIDYQGKAKPVNGLVSSQDFNGSIVPDVPGADATIANQYVVTTTGKGTSIKGDVKNAAIIDTTDKDHFTRIYGRETGKMYNGAFVVRPGFDSNIVPTQHDNRLQPNETEVYGIQYDLLPGDYTVSYKVYYMQKGANGLFVPSNPKLMITEVFSDEKNVTINP